MYASDYVTPEDIEKNKIWYEMLSQYKQIPLWENEIPFWVEEYGQHKPSMTLFMCDGAEKRGCVLVVPGGRYIYKSANEGANIAQRLNKDGINAAILDYRVIPYTREVILQDAKRAIRYLRYNAENYNILPDKIGVLGFSAGGNLAALTGFCGDDGDKDSDDPIERVSSRPDAAVLCYAAVVFVDEYDVDEDEIDILSYFDFVLKDNMTTYPPTFIWQSMRDKTVNFNIALNLCKKINKLGAPVEMHLFPYGGHAQGLADTEKGEINNGDNNFAVCWSDLCIRWLKLFGF